jgi:hypothetical protein
LLVEKHFPVENSEKEIPVENSKKNPSQEFGEKKIPAFEIVLASS